MAKGQEALEFVEGVFAIGLHAAAALQDGFQVSDLPAMLMKSSADPVVLAGLKGVQDMPAEVVADPLAFSLDLLEASLSFTRKILKMYLTKKAV